MTRALLGVLFTTAILHAAPAPEEPPSPAPIPIQARLAEGKVQIEVTVPVTVYRTQQRTTRVVENGVVITRTQNVNVPITVLERRVFVAGDDLQILDATGARVARDRLPELLKGSPSVLLSADGKPVNSSHLRTAKSGTLVFVLPSYKAPTPPTTDPPEQPTPPPQKP